jgi:hypothetical protein
VACSEKIGAEFGLQVEKPDLETMLRRLESLQSYRYGHYPLAKNA